VGNKEGPIQQAGARGSADVLMLVGVLLTVTLLPVGGCHQTVSTEANERVESAIIVVPGYYGTRLAQGADGDLVFISAWESLFGTRSLVLPFPGIENRQSIELRPDGILQTVPVIPGLYSVDVYGSLLDAFARFRDGHAAIVPLAYDWRADLHQVVRDLHSEVRRIRTQGVKRIAVVAHSMGGLIAGYYLRYGAQSPDEAKETWEGVSHIDAVVLTGVPFRGSMTIFRNMQYGRRFGLNTTLLDQEAVASFPASYFVLPSAEADLLLTPRLEPVKGLIRQARNWRTYGWGLLKEARQLSSDLEDQRAAYIDHWLTQADRFTDRLLAPLSVPNRTPIPLLAVAGRGQDTLATGVLGGPDPASPCTSLIFDEHHFNTCLPEADPSVRLEDGDGTVTVRSASLPEAYEQAFVVTHRVTTAGHGELVSDADLQADMLAFLGTALPQQ
jgi:pimeloyl-ACP methyl ester carboxylesterase